MRTKYLNAKKPSEQVVKDIRRATRKRHSAEEKIQIVLNGLRGEYSIAALCGFLSAHDRQRTFSGRHFLAGVKCCNDKQLILRHVE